MNFIRPGKPAEDSFIESFHRSLRDECLATNWFSALDDTRRTTEEWGSGANIRFPLFFGGSSIGDERR